MRNDTQPSAISKLSYLDASKVSSPAGVLSELEFLTADGKRLGSIAGVVIDAAAHCVRYFDIQSSGWFRRQRYLISADQLAQVSRERKALRLRVDTRAEAVHNVDVGALRKFSDDDLLAALFPAPAA